MTREGHPGELYSHDVDVADGKAFLSRCEGDRHQFRFIVSAEDGADFDDLKPLTRRLMSQMEADLGTKLDWVAVDHFNTGHPHTHIMLRGKTDRGENLVIARDYIAHGIRERLTELLTIDLGPKTDLEIARKLRLDIDAERLTRIDRRMLLRLDDDRTVRPAARDSYFHSLEAGRLQTLVRLGLAEEVVPGRWKLVEGIEEKLRAFGERGDIIRTMQRELLRAGSREGAGRNRIHDVSEQGVLVGRVVARGLADEHRDRHFLIVDAVDGDSHYVDVGNGGAVDDIACGSVVRVSPASDTRDSRGNAVNVEILTAWPLKELVGAEGTTWLDRELISSEPLLPRDMGFGREARAALTARRQWLMQQGLAEDREGATHYRADLLSVLERRDLARAAQRLSEETSLGFVESKLGRFSGLLKQRVDLVSGSYAMIETGREFTLVPWRPILERRIGLDVAGAARSDGIRWSLGRRREGPTIS